MIAMRLYLLSFLLLCCTCFAHGVSITSFNFNRSSYATYQKVQASFEFDETYSNPYDPDVIKVDAAITRPDGSVDSMPCFYYVPCDYSQNGGNENQANCDESNATWMMRYSPEAAGDYQVQLNMVDGNGTFTSSTYNFSVSASGSKGFIRQDQNNNQFYRFENGDPYYPNGFNLAWNDNHTLNQSYYEYFNKMAPENINWCRYWLTPFQRQALEWNSGHWSGWYNGLGEYSQEAAGVLDSVLAMCNRHDIYMQLVFQHHGQVSANVNAMWADNPYNTDNGGMLDTTTQFFFNNAAMEQTKKQYRYIVARWGYSTNIFTWELFNEVHYTGGINSDVDSWHDEMSRYVQSLDPHDHLITSSSSEEQLTAMDDNSAMDLLQYHVYAQPVSESLFSASRRMLDALNKPVLCGEYGASTGNSDYENHPDDWGDHVRKASWQGIFTEVPNMFWFWNRYVDGKNLYSMYGHLHDYLEGEDLVASTGADYEALAFNNNPVVNGTATAVPGLTGFEDSSEKVVYNMQPDGSFNEMYKLNAYLEGDGDPDRADDGQEVTFNVTLQSAGTATMDVAGASGWNSPQTVEAYVDGSLQNTFSISGAGTFSVDVPQGEHSVRFVNTGTDWVEVNQYQFDPVAISSLKGYGYKGNEEAYGFIKDGTYGQWSDPASVNTISGSELVLAGLTSGDYEVTFFNPRDGSTNDAGTYSTSDDTLAVPLPDFKKDLAYKISATSLGVGFLEFNGQADEHRNVLKWHADKANADYFEVLRSEDGKNFSAIGKVAVKGKGSSGYQYVDKVRESKPYYYRLKQVNKDGSQNYSRIIQLGVSDNPKRLTLYPNPASEKTFVRMKLTAPTGLKISLYDTQGRKIKAKQVNGSQGVNLFPFRVSGLSSGTYVVKVQGTGRELVRSGRLVVE